MVEQEKLTLRNRIIGVLLQDARMRAGKTRQKCAEVLGTSVGVITAYEEGRQAISLPELELLARYLGVPATHLLDPDAGLLPDEKPVKVPERLALRQRIVGALLRQARLEARKSQKDLASVLGCSTRRIAAYEYGEQPIPVAELEALASFLERPLTFFLDEDSLVGQSQDEIEAFQALPQELRDFVVKPINRSYLEVAMKLAEMPAGALRAIAEGILDITY
jgi:transcriptional regulator with XRE-family HTH domain